ncbi:MAG: cation transporter [Bauldia sp.]|nr:cation transporter [Bauldia sp.]
MDKRLSERDEALRRTVGIVAGLNLAYFGVEFAVAIAIGAVSLFADSIDFLEDASVNLLVFFALRWSARKRARAGMALAGLILVPALATLWAVSQKFLHPVVPDPFSLSLTGVGAMAVNLTAALLLVRFRTTGGSLARGAFLSARNDVLANIAIVAAALVTAWMPSIWPDLVVGLGIAALNADAAREVWEAAREERKAANP